MIWISPLLFIGLLGVTAVVRITRQLNLPYKPLFLAAISLPTGFSISSIALFIAYLIHPGHGFFIALISLITLMCFLLRDIFLNSTADVAASKFDFLAWLKTRREQWRALSRLQKIASILTLCLFIFSLIKVCSVYQSVSLSNIFGGWDARYFWNVKAKFFFRSPAEWQNMFAPDLDWAHPDYPLLIPGSVAWGWFWTGKELQIWPAMVAFSFYISFALWITWFISVSTRLINGLLAGAFFMTVGTLSFWSISQYADVPLAYFITASASLLIMAHRTKQIPLLLLAGWFAGCAAWSKNEGMLFFIWFGIAFAALHIRALFNFMETKKQIIPLTLGACLPLICVFILKVDLAPHGDYLGSGRSAGDFITSIFGDFEKTKTILKGFVIYLTSYSSWNGLWFLFLTALITGLTARHAIEQKTAYLAGMTLLILLGYLIVLHTSPHNIVFQIQTAMERLLIHASGLAILFIFEAFGKLVAGKQTSNKQ